MVMPMVLSVSALRRSWGAFLGILPQFVAIIVVAGLTGAGLRVVCVTHLHEFSRALSAQGRPDALFLRAERLDDGRRTFRIVPGDPRPTSHGEDIWAAVMGES